MNGLLFDPRSAESFQGQLRRLVDDAGLRGRLGEAARETALLELSPETVTSDWTSHVRHFMKRSVDAARD